MRPWPALLRCALAGMVMLAVGFGSTVMVLELVLAPSFSTGAADEELRAPFAAQIGQTLDQHDARADADRRETTLCSAGTGGRDGR